MEHLYRRLLRALAAASLVMVWASPAQAQNDRIMDTPTAWAYLYASNATAIIAQINAGFRPFAIEQVSSGLYDVVFVHNSGPYAVPGANITFNRTPQSMIDYLTANNLRLLDLEVYDDGSGGTRMTGIVVPNSGISHTPEWGWVYDTSFATISTWMMNNPSLRLIDLDSYVIDGVRLYSAVAVRNSGNNFQAQWSEFNNVTTSELTQLLQANNARLVQLDVVSAGALGAPARFTALLVSSSPGGGWWYPSLTTDQITTLINQNGARITCLKRYTNLLGQTRWAVAMVDNVNLQTRRMRGYIGSAIADGSYGFQLKQVGGPVLAGLNVEFVYEPASMIKIVHAAYAIRMCALGNDNLVTPVYSPNRCTSTAFIGMCPDPYPVCSPGFETLSVCIQSMMQLSHNTYTRVVEERYGRGILNLFAGLNGMGNIFINHTIGCGPMNNTMTCADSVMLYEKIANGTFFSSAWRDQLFSLMVNLQAYGYGSDAFVLLSNIINQEAAATTLTSFEIQLFRSAVRHASKAGGYEWGSNPLFYNSEGAWARLPFKVNSGGSWIISPREYALAGFIHASSDGVGANVIYNAKFEILREQIRQALLSWEAACDAPAITSHPRDVSSTLGGQASFSAGATGSFYNLAYQWQHEHATIPGAWINMTNTPGRYSGVHTSQLVISNVSQLDARRYRLRVTNRCGSATTVPVLLTIGSPPCYANCDESTTPPILTVDDFTCFIDKFAAAQGLPHAQQVAHYANCDGSTTAPVLTVDDFTCFINEFAAGCP